MSVDSVFSHRAFAEQIGITFPLLADFHPKGAVAQAYGIWNEDRGTADRAVFLVDREGIVRWRSLYETGLPDNGELLAEAQLLAAAGSA